MPIELKIPSIGESVTEVQIGTWFKKEGDFVKKDEDLVELESDKATLALPAPESGRLVRVLKKAGDEVAVGEVIAHIEAGDAQSAGATSEAAPPAPSLVPAAGAAPSSAKQAAAPAAKEAKDVTTSKSTPDARPAKPLGETPATTSNASSDSDTQVIRISEPETGDQGSAPHRQTEVKPMSPMRRTIAARLVESQQTTASLTTFNEVDMSALMALRTNVQDQFKGKHGIKLGFMSFFVKASIEALKEFPAINASIEGRNVVYHNYYDIGVAVGTDRGLVVPIIRNAERKGFAGVEQEIIDLAERARTKKIEMSELEGGTFTITNGGVYGSMLSTPILNPPQSGILGLHNIKKRAVVLDDDSIAVRPMMYIALTYDHRLVDGKEAVTFLVRVKELIEQPVRMMLEM